MFRGRFFNVMDDKGRITIPPRYREILSERRERHLIVTNLDGYLIAFPQTEWEDIEQRLSKLSILDKKFRSFQRFFVVFITFSFTFAKLTNQPLGNYNIYCICKKKRFDAHFKQSGNSTWRR